MKMSHALYSSDEADEAMSKVQEKKTSKHHFMLSGKPREVESAATKHRHVLTPVDLPKMGYIQITVTEVVPWMLLYCM